MGRGEEIGGAPGAPEDAEESDGGADGGRGGDGEGGGGEEDHGEKAVAEDGYGAVEIDLRMKISKQMRSMRKTKM